MTSASGMVAGIVTVPDLLELIAKQKEHASNKALREALRARGWDEETGRAAA